MKWRRGLLFKIKTENYLLYPLTPENLSDDMMGWFRDPEVMKYFVMPMDTDREQLCQILRTFNNDHRYWLGIDDRKSGQKVGFFLIYCNYLHKQVRTGICIGDKQYWGKRCVQEVRASVLKFVFTQMKMHKVFGDVDVRNFPSIFNYKSQGFRCEGILRKERLGQDGVWHDHFRFAILHDEWLQQRTESSVD